MHHRLTRIFVFLLSGTLSAVASGTSLESFSLAQLEQQQQEIDSQLASLASYSLGSGIGAIGYRSRAHETADHLEWVQIELGEKLLLEEIVLVPAIRRDAANGFQADGFPKAFRLIAGTEQDPEGAVIATFSSENGVLPRIAPLVIPCTGTLASWIRVEASTLTQRAFDGLYVFQLSEVLAFSATDNVALHKPVSASSSTRGYGWAEKYLVDGFMPYLMDAARGAQSVAFITTTNLGENADLTVDLEESLPISRIHLHAVDQTDTVPQAFAGDVGIPKWLRIEGANSPDFSDAAVLADTRHQTIYDVGPIIMHSFPETKCRYVRVTVMEPNVNLLYGQMPDRLGFAEIQIFSSGSNVALHKTVTANFTVETPVRRLYNLTDGLNMYGEVLPIRDWMMQLALRHELENERPRVVAELSHRYARQKTILKGMIRLTILLVLGTVVIVFVDRIMRQRAIERTRKRIAADLHDELGANLHAIGLLSDFAENRLPPESLRGVFQRLRTLSERTAQAANDCTNMLEARGLYGDLADDMRRASNRILADLEHDSNFEGEAMLCKLRPQERVDLLLFYQECLTNIIRHSGATRAHTRLVTTEREINLTVSDNGRGLDGGVPASLQRRARLLGAVVEARRSDASGTSIHLRLKLSPFRLPFRFLR